MSKIAEARKIILFVLIWMYFSCWIRIWEWKFEFYSFVKLSENFNLLSTVNICREGVVKGVLHPKAKLSIFWVVSKLLTPFWKILKASWSKLLKKFKNGIRIRPFPNTSAPARLRLSVPHVSTKALKSSLSLHAKILFYVWNEWIKYCKRYHYEVNRSVLHVNC